MFLPDAAPYWTHEPSQEGAGSSVFASSKLPQMSAPGAFRADQSDLLFQATDPGWAGTAIRQIKLVPQFRPSHAAGMTAQLLPDRVSKFYVTHNI